MKKEQISQVKEKLENIINTYAETLQKLTDCQKECNRIANKLQEQSFVEYNKGKYLEWETTLIKKQELSFALTYFETNTQKVFNSMSVEIIGLLFDECRSRRDITDFEKLMEYDTELKKYPYLVSVRFLNDTIGLYLHNNYNNNISFKYYNRSNICKNVWNEKKCKWEDLVLYENFSTETQQECFNNYKRNNAINHTIIYEIKDILKEHNKLQELLNIHTKEKEDLQKRHAEEIKSADKYNIHSIMVNR